MNHGPTTLSELRHTLQSAAQTPSQAAAMADLLPDMIRRLPPERGQLASRTKFSLGSDSILQAQFDDVETSGGNSISSPEVIEVDHDTWIRGCSAYAVVQLPGGEEQVPLLAFDLIRLTTERIAAKQAACGRWTFDVNWRLDGKQGFVQRGASGEVLAPANLVTGTGQYIAPMDWRLQKDQTISVRIRNNLGDFLNIPLIGETTPAIKLIVVAFYGLRLPLAAGASLTAFG